MTLVERLADKRREGAHCESCHLDETFLDYDTRWWLNAIADELEETFYRNDEHPERGLTAAAAYHHESIIRWLRSQTQEEAKPIGTPEPHTVFPAGYEGPIYTHPPVEPEGAQHVVCSGEPVSFEDVRKLYNEVHHWRRLTRSWAEFKGYDGPGETREIDYFDKYLAPRITTKDAEVEGAREALKALVKKAYLDGCIEACGEPHRHNWDGWWAMFGKSLVDDFLMND